jgi:hypothetical protein
MRSRIRGSWLDEIVAAGIVDRQETRFVLAVVAWPVHQNAVHAPNGWRVVPPGLG